MSSSKKILFCVSVLFIVSSGITALWYVGHNEGYAPTQPIPFSHRLHAGKYQIPCMYCHAGVEKSRHATVPAMNVCMNCHSVVKPESPHIQTLKKLYSEKKDPFRWIKVHDLPDHVYFSHKRHVTKGISCETCHGDVKRMDRITQEKPLTMGWCLDCHRGQTAPQQLYIAGQPIDHPPLSGEKYKKAVAPTSCYTCHH